MTTIHLSSENSDKELFGYEPISHTPINESFKCFKWVFSTTQNILYLFDNCIVDEHCVFVYCRLGTKEYIKSYAELSNVDTYVDHIQNYNSKIDENNEHDEYMIAYITYDKSIQRIIITSEYVECEQLTSIRTSEYLVKLYFPPLTEQITKVVPQISKTRGIFYAYNIDNFNKDIFKMFIMTHPLAQKYLMVRENVTLKKLRKTNTRILFSYVDRTAQPKVYEITLSMMYLTLEEGQTVFKTRYWRDIGKNNPYLLIATTIQQSMTTEVMTNMLSTFARLLRVYTATSVQYNNFITRIDPKLNAKFAKVKTTKKVKPIVEKAVKLKYKVPEMIKEGYSKACQRKQKGMVKEITTYDTAEETLEHTQHLDQKVKYLAYPADQQYLDYLIEEKGLDDLEPVPIDGPTRYFACEHEGYTHAGLILNPTDNNDVYPYLPCCFKEDQLIPTAKAKSRLWNYLHGISSDDKQTTTTTAVITGKIQLSPDSIGPVPVQLEDLFKIKMSTHTFNRFGIGGPRSTLILSCLQKALGLEQLNMIDILKTDDNNNIGVLTQSNWEMDVQEMIDTFSNQDNYLDPRRIVPFLQAFFKVNIILFGDVELAKNTYETTIILPRNKYGYLTWDTHYDKTVLIYLSTGSKHINPERCELIVATDNNTNDVVTVFDEYMCEYLMLTSYKIYKQYSLFTPYSVFSLPVFLKLKNGQHRITEQSLDAYGKIKRILVTDDNGDTFTLDTQPLPPIPDVITKHLDITPLTNPAFLTYIIKNSTYVVKEETNSIIFKIDNISYVVYYNLPPLMSNIELFIKESHCANVMKDVFVYMFSQYVQSESIDVSQLERYAKTFADTIMISDSYTKAMELLNNHPPVFQQDETLLYPNLKCKERLLYYLNMLLAFNPSYVLEMYTKEHLDHYYTNIYDFKINTSYNLCSSLNTVNLFYNQITVSNKILYEKDTPYFLNNKLTFHDTPVLTINFNLLDDAVKLSYFWKKYRFIPIIDGSFAYPGYFEYNDYKNYCVINFDSPPEDLLKQFEGMKEPDVFVVSQKVLDTQYFCPLLS